MVKENSFDSYTSGNSWVALHEVTGQLLVINTSGLVKSYTLDEFETEKHRVDISEDFTSMTVYGSQVAITSVSGELEMVDLSKHETQGKIYRSELPLRDSVFVNDGKRVVVAGDDNVLVIIDLENNNDTKIPLQDQAINLSYNKIPDLLTVSLANGNLEIYSMSKEIPELIDTLESVLPQKINTSTEFVVIDESNKEELMTCKPIWTVDGEMMAIPTKSSNVSIYSRSNFKKIKSELEQINTTSIIDLKFSPNEKYLAIVNVERELIVFDLNSEEIVEEFTLSELPLNFAWTSAIGASHYDCMVGTIGGGIIKVGKIVPMNPPVSSIANKVHVEEAEESFGEESDDEEFNKAVAPLSPNLLNEEDDFVIDDDNNGYSEPIKKRTLDDLVDFDEDNYNSDGTRKKTRSDSPTPASSTSTIGGIQTYKLAPYSPGSTPWVNVDGDRRYLTMNSTGYAWAVKTSTGDQQSITVSFFDRSENKDYYINDLYNYDLCCMNSRALLLGCSGLGSSKAKIYYRSHGNANDSWTEDIPLATHIEEYVTSISMSDDKIFVGSSLGSLWIYDKHGWCISAERLSPIFALLASNHLLFIITLTSNVFNYSIINLDNNMQYYQQNSILPLNFNSGDTTLILKGLFFNEYNDPCIVGSDDVVLILTRWRNPLQTKWVMLLNSYQEVNKRNRNKDAKCWPLGLYGDTFNCIVVRGGKNDYPGFPLPLPVELDIRIPVKCTAEDETAPMDEETEQDPLLLFNKSKTMGEAINDSLNDDFLTKDDDEIVERLNAYSVSFDKSVLKLFASACSESKLAKAFAIITHVKNDKALLAASRIAERMELLNLATRIGKLREDRLQLDDE